MDYEIINIVESEKSVDELAEWFSGKWGIPKEAYVESMEDSLKGSSAVPQWYYVEDEGRIIAGIGVIENDFHDRRDLAPNVCAVYVEPEYRRRGIAGCMLDRVCRDMYAKGIDTLYLLTSHVGFYERYGWNFLCMLNPDDSNNKIQIYIHTQEENR